METRRPTTPANKAVMRAGRHYVTFTGSRLRGDEDVEDTIVGVLRPGWDVQEAEAHRVHGHCFYSSYTGYHFRTLLPLPLLVLLTP
jgi:hypothetical protein